MRAGAGAAATAVAVRLAAPEPELTPHGRAVQIDSVLGRVCRSVREALDVARATVLVFEEPGALSPAVSVAREEHDELWQRFRTMRPISLDISPEAAAALRGEQVFVVPDAASSPMVPAEWQYAFSLTSLAVAPIHVDGRPWGALVVDDGDRRYEFGRREVRLLGELAGLAGIALAAAARAASAEAETVLRAALRDAVARLTVTNDLAAAIDFVAPSLLEASGYELIGGGVRELRIARVVNVRTMSGYDPDALRRLRGGDPDALARNGRVLVPMRGTTGLLGVLQLRSHATRAKRLDLCHEVAERFAAVVAQLSAADRERARGVEADHAAARLDLALRGMTQTLRTFRGVGYGQRTGGPTLFPVASSNQARRAVDDLDEVRQVLRAQGESPSVTAALRALLDPPPSRPYELAWTTSGTPRAVGSEGEIALLLTAVRFLGMARESRGRILAARVSFMQDGVDCLLSSDGMLRDPAAVTSDGTIERLGPWVREIGGTVELDAGEAAFSARLTLPYAPSGRTSSDRRPAPARARFR